MQTAGLIVVCLGGEQQQKSVRSDVGKLIPPGRVTKKTRSVQQGCRFVPKKHVPKLFATDGTKPNQKILVKQGLGGLMKRAKPATLRGGDLVWCVS